MIKLTVIFPSDPLGKKVGGAETYINDVIQFAPPDFDIEFIGITTNKKERPIKKWSLCHLGNRKFKFYALCFLTNEDKKPLIPLSLYFTFWLSLSGIDFHDKVLFFNRIEPALILRHVSSPKIGIIHSDIRQLIDRKGNEVLWSRFPWLYLMMEDLIFRSLRHVYIVNRRTLEFYQEHYQGQKEKFSFLPTWANREIFFPVSETKSSLRKNAYFSKRFLPMDKRWLLYVGRLQEVKAPLRLIETFFEYRKKDKASCLFIIGDGNLRGEVEKHIKRLNLQNDVFLLGSIPKTVLVHFYRASDALILTSNFEGMPKCVIEALACGLPVVSTDVGEVSLVVRNDFSGEVVKDLSAQAVAFAIEKVLKNPMVYTSSNCLESVSAYTPQKILAPLFEDLRNLYSIDR